jgi:hypothetical protein
MARVETIVVGGGVAATAPFTTGQIPLISATVPPALSDSVIRQVTGKIIVGTTDPQPAATEILRTAGGFISEGSAADSFIAGRGASAASVDSIAIGRAASVATSVGGIAIGAGAVVANLGIAIGVSANAFVANSFVLIGGSASFAGGGVGNSAVLIGHGATQTAGTSSVGIGATVNIAQNNAVAIGATASVTAANGVAIGNGATVTGTSSSSMSIGFGVTCANLANALTIGASVAAYQANTVLIGHSNGFTEFTVGKGNVAAAPQALLFRLTNGSGTNIAGGALTLQAGLGTGNAASARVNLAVGAPGASGATLQGALTCVAAAHTATATETGLMIFDVDNGVLERVTVGAADSGGVGFKLLRIPN